MRHHHRFIWVLGLLAGLAVATCQFPTDKSDEVYVTIEAPAQVVLDGDEMSVRARAWRTMGGARDSGTVDDVAIENVDFQWTASNGTVARVLPGAQGNATLQGLNAGLTDISARATVFEQSDDATFPLRVSNFLEIDSVTPSFVKWGDKLTLWGVGVRFAFSVSLPGQSLIPDTATYVESGGLSHMEFWVPQPAFTGNLFVVGPGVFFNPPGTIAVDTLDLYEPNTTAPAPIDLNGPGPYPTRAPNVLFFNPALAFEQLPRDTFVGYDWYRFDHNDTAQALTVILKPQGLTDSSGLFIVLSDSILFAGGGHQPGAGATWFMTNQGGSHCSRGTLFPFVEPAESMVVALKTRPRYVPGNNGLHLLTFYGQRFNYAVAVVKGYLTADPRLPPDRFEENDICDMADAPAKLFTVGPVTPFSDTLNIDNPQDIDWIRFTVNAPLASDSTMVRIHSRPFPGALFDRSDIDLYILRVSPFGVVATVSAAGSDDSLRVQLPSGDYYLAAIDFAGEPTRYSVCIAVRFACTPPAASATTREHVVRFRTGPDGLRPDGKALVRAAAETPAAGNPFRP